MSDAALIAADDAATRALRNSPVDRAASVGEDPTRNPATAAAAGRTPGARRPLPNYELGEQIGAGGMGTVYKATHIWLGRPVAVKFISKEALGDPEAIARFAHESRAIGRLDHANIVRATDAGCVGGAHFLVTEFVDGCDLARLVKTAGPLRAADACEIVRQAALGLQHAHEQQLVHRDVKPSNLLLNRAGIVKLLDFGLARLASNQTTLTTTGQMIGTLDFLAPEQASDARRVDIRSDIYSLGCTLYYLLTGQPPFSGPDYGTPASKIKGHLADRPQLPTTGRRRIRLPIVACLERMMAKSPDERYATPAAVAAARRAHARGANLPALVANVVGNEAAPFSHAAREPFGSGFVQALESLPLMIGRGFKRLFFHAPSFEGRSRREPIISIGGVIGLIALALIFSHFSCVPQRIPGEFNGGVEPEVHYFRFGPAPADHP